MIEQWNENGGLAPVLGARFAEICEELGITPLVGARLLKLPGVTGYKGNMRYVYFADGKCGVTSDISRIKRVEWFYEGDYLYVYLLKNYYEYVKDIDKLKEFIEWISKK